MFRYAIFDLDGTLLNTLQDLADACNYALRQAELPEHPVYAYRTFVGNGTSALMERILPARLCRDNTLKSRLLADFSAYYALHKQDHTRPYPGICTLLKKLRAAQIGAAVVSNKPAAFVPEITARYFSGLVDVSIGLTEGASPKPDPAGLQKAMRLLGASPACTLYVGDSDVDVKTAHHIPGLLCCGVLWGFRGKHELTRAGADFLARNAKELEDLIFGL